MAKRDFAAERTALAYEEDAARDALIAAQKKIKTLYEDMTLELFGVKPGDIVRSDGKTYRVTGVYDWYWGPHLTPFVADRYEWHLPTNQPEIMGEMLLKSGEFGIERRIYYRWEKVEQEQK